MMHIKESHIAKRNNDDSGYFITDPICEETDLTRGEIFRMCLREFGKCVSKVYVDKKNGETKEVGWVFQKRREYCGHRGHSKDSYLHEVWVEVLEIK